MLWSRLQYALDKMGSHFAPKQQEILKNVPILSNSHFIAKKLQRKTFSFFQKEEGNAYYLQQICCFSQNASPLIFIEFPFYREKVASQKQLRSPFYRIPILSRAYCISSLIHVPGYYRIQQTCCKQ